MEWDTMAEVEDKRIRRTKKLLRQALTRLMQQKDFQSITVTDVVREADINRGTFYAHYRDVYDLRDKIETGMIEDFRGMIAAIRPSETVTLKLVLSRLMDYLEENREIVTALIKVNAQDGFGFDAAGMSDAGFVFGAGGRNDGDDVHPVCGYGFCRTGLHGFDHRLGK